MGVRKLWYKNRQGKRVQTANWYAEWTNAAGKSARRKVGRDKRAAEAFLVKMQDQVARQRAGLGAAPSHDARTRSLTEWQADYLADLATRDVSPGYVTMTTKQLDAAVRWCRWLIWTDVAAADLTRYLAHRREAHGNSNGTLNTHLNTVKTWARWVADKLDARSPLRALKPFNVEVTRKRSKRVLTDPELTALIAAAEAARGGGKTGAIRGPRRAWLYRLAAFTGLRAKELAAVRPESFHLDATPPVVVVEAKDQKGKRDEPVPVPSHLVAPLRAWLATQPAGQPLWPGTWAKNREQWSWMRRDVKRAGIAERDARGRNVTFHGLRRRYVTRLFQAGGTVPEVRRLARHKDVRTTLNHYTDETMGELAALADKLGAV